MKTKTNRHRHTPIPWLALHIAMMNRDCGAKAALAAARAAIADRFYAISQPETAEFDTRRA